MLSWIAVPFLVFFSTTNDTNFHWGAILMIAGELVRIWSLGFVEEKGEILAMNGPYAFTRNPLYIGNFFLGLGIAVICANWIILALFIIGFAVIYRKTILNEEKDLLERRGAMYENYCKNVPRFFPRLIPYRSPVKVSFDWRRVIKHHEYVTILGIILALCGIRLYDKLFCEKDPIASQTGLIAVTAIIILILALERFFISNFKKTFEEGFPNLFHKKQK